MRKYLIVDGIWNEPFQLFSLHCLLSCRWYLNLEYCVSFFLPIGLFSSHAIAPRDSLSETNLQRGCLRSEAWNFENYACASAYFINVAIISVIPARRLYLGVVERRRARTPEEQHIWVYWSQSHHVHDEGLYLGVFPARAFSKFRACGWRRGGGARHSQVCKY